MRERSTHWVIVLGRARATAETLPAAEVAARTLEADAAERTGGTTIDVGRAIVVGPWPGRAREAF